MDTRFSTALHILTFISESEEEANSRVLAESVNTNPSHIRKIAAQLKNAGIVESRQGKAGFTLARGSEAITFSDVYRAVYPEKSLLNVHEDANPECPIGKHISAVLEPTFSRIEDTLLESLAEISLADLIQYLYQSASSPQKD